MDDASRFEASLLKSVDELAIKTNANDVKSYNR